MMVTSTKTFFSQKIVLYSFYMNFLFGQKRMFQYWYIYFIISPVSPWKFKIYDVSVNTTMCSYYIANISGVLRQEIRKNLRIFLKRATEFNARFWNQQNNKNISKIAKYNQVYADCKNFQVETRETINVSTIAVIHLFFLLGIFICDLFQIN